MSQFGMTPISILDKSPMGGFRGGLSDQRSLMHSDSNLMSETLAQEAQRMQNETTQLNRPVDAVKRAAELAKLEEEMVLRQQGHFRDKEETELRGKKVDIENKVSEENRKKYLAAAEGAMHASSVFSPDDDDAARAAKWGTAVQIAKAAGLSNIPSDYSEYNYQRLMERAKAAPTAIKHLQSMEAQSAQDSAAMQRVGVQEYGQNQRNAATNATSEANSRRSASATIQAARERADAGNVYLRTEEQRVLQTVEEANKDGKPIGMGTVQQLAANAMQAAEAAVVKGKSEIETAKSQAAMKHENVAAAAEAKAQEIRDRVIKNYMSRADGLSVSDGTKVVAKLQGGKLVPVGKPAPKAATSDIPTPSTGGPATSTQPIRPQNAKGQKRDPNTGRITHWQLNDGTIVPAQ